MAMVTARRVVCAARAGIASAMVVAMVAMAAPTAAYADSPLPFGGWQMGDIAPGAEEAAGVYTQDVVLGFAHSLVTTLLGAIVGVFVLKVVLTGIDRLMFGGSGASQGFRLDDIPIIGAYRDPERDTGPGSPGDQKTSSPWTWRRIWVHFGIQIALCLGALTITNVLMGIIATAFGAAGVVAG